MTASPRELDRAFRALERALLARRWAALGVRVRVLLALIGANVAAIAYWQARVPLDGACRAHGPAGGALRLAAGLGALALAGGALAAWRRARLAARPPGPEWLALPLPAARVLRHLRGEARLPALALFVPALAALAAGHGLLPLAWLLLLAAGFVLAWLEATRAGIALAWRAAAPRTPSSLPLATRALAAATRPARAHRRAAAAWRSEPRWRALVRLDLAVSLRRSPARARLTLAALAIAASFGAWSAPAPPAAQRALAFLGLLAASAALGAWAIARTCADPPDVMHALPLDWRTLWRARATLCAAALVAAALVHVALARTLPLATRLGLPLEWLPPLLAVAVLGVHYGLTLAPRSAAAETLYFGWLLVAGVASWMIPLLGWLVVLAGLVHSGLRLPRWTRPEVA